MRLAFESVTKDYPGKVTGLKNLTMTLGPCILGLLGPNGAGKSTMMDILATVARPTSGTVTFNGINIHQSPDALREVLGYLPQDFGVYPNLSAQEFLEYMAAVKGLDRLTTRRRIDTLLESLNLGAARHRPLGGFSGGMRQRVGIAQALLNEPQVLIVDEPTVGLDPEERVRFRNLLTQLAGERIVILSTHIVSDVESTATEIALMRKGELLIHARPEELLSAITGQVWEFGIPSDQWQDARTRWLISASTRRKETLHLRVISRDAPHDLAQPVPPNLEDAYLFWINGGAQESAV